jgi:osmoprotectant transport system substrate-binding protein
MKISGIGIAALFAVSVTVLTGCGAGTQKVSVGTKSSTQQQVLGEIIAQHLEKRLGKESVVRRFGIGSTKLAQSAMLAGEIDLYPEDTGSALSLVLDLPPAEDAEGVREQVRENYRNRFRFEWFGPFGFADSSVAVIPAEFGKLHGVQSLSQAAAYEPGWAIGVQTEFAQRSDGLPLMMRQYRLPMSAALRTVEGAGAYRALELGEVNMVVGTSTDVEMQNGKFLPLADDKRVFKPRESGTVVRSEALERLPNLAASLRELNGRIGLEEMKRMIRQVDTEGKSAEVVAAQFLKDSGL